MRPCPGFPWRNIFVMKWDRMYFVDNIFASLKQDQKFPFYLEDPHQP